MQILDPSDQKRSDFDLRDDSEMFSVKDGVFPAVLYENRNAAERDRLYGMKFSRKKDIFGFFRLINITITVIMIYAKTEDETNTVPVAVGEFWILKQISDGVTALLDRNHGSVLYFVGAEQSVARRNQRVRIRIDRTEFFTDPTGETVIEAGVMFRLILGFVNARPVKKRFNQRLRQRRIQKRSAEL